MKRKFTDGIGSLGSIFSIGSKSIKLFAFLAFAGIGAANAQFGVYNGHDEPMVKGLNDPALRGPGANAQPIKNITVTPICPGMFNMNMVDMGFDKVLLEWNNGFNYDSLVFRFALSGSGVFREVRIPANPNPGQYFLQGLLAQTTYDISMCSVCSGGIRSGWSNTVTITTLNEPGPRYQNNVRNSHQLSMSPNPATNATNISFYSQTDSRYQIMIVSATGKEMYKRSVDVSMGQNSIQVDLTSFAPGLYFVRLGNGSVTSIEKLMVN